MSLLLTLALWLLLGAQVTMPASAHSSSSPGVRASDHDSDEDSDKGSKEKSSKGKKEKEKEKEKKEKGEDAPQANSNPGQGAEQPTGQGDQSQPQGTAPPANSNQPASQEPAKKPKKQKSEDKKSEDKKSESKKPKSDSPSKKDEDGESKDEDGESKDEEGEGKKGSGEKKDSDEKKGDRSDPDADDDSGRLRAQGQGDSPAPAVKNVNAEPVQGEVTVKPKGSDEFIPLGELGQIPLGSVIDAREGAVEIASPVTPRGVVQSATFSEAAFKVMQSQIGANPVVLRLVGGDFGACTATASGKKARAARSKRSIRRLWGKGKGLFRTRGRYSSASVRGTNWLTEDRCDGTLTRVRTGVVEVCDYGLGRKVRVRAGESYLARPRTGRLPAPIAERRCRV